MRLLDLLFPPRVDEKVVREIATDDFLLLVAPTLVPYTRPGTVALLPFSNAWVRSAIHEAKYHGNERALELLSLALADYLHDSDEQPHKTVIVPIPLGKQRRKDRGFNQVEEVIGRTLRDHNNDHTLDTTLLRRARETVSQVSLPRKEREENMRGAFGTACPANPRVTYIVIDDVITTGATLQAAVDALREAGATTIVPLAFAH